MNTKFNRERIRFDVKQPDTLVIQGWFEDDTEGAEQFEAERNGAPAAIDVQVQRGVEVTKKDLAHMGNGGFCLGCKTCHYPNCGFGKGG